MLELHTPTIVVCTILLLTMLSLKEVLVTNDGSLERMPKLIFSAMWLLLLGGTLLVVALKYVAEHIRFV